MAFDVKKLEQKIETATREAFQEMVEKHQQERIYAFALYSDEGAMTVCPSTNTMDYLETKPNNDFTYYKFQPAEWKYEGDGADKKFAKICNKLYKEVEKDKYDDDESLFEDFQNELYQTCIGVLKKLKQENFFKNILGYDIFLMFSVTDYEQDRNFLAQTITSLNENPYRDEYLEWMKTWRN